MRSMIGDIMRLRETTNERRFDLLQNLLDARAKRGGIFAFIQHHAQLYLNLEHSI